MPTYGYRCQVCGHEFERFQKMTDAPVSACETCGGGVKKMLYPVGISFKGDGFYVNDYAPKSAKNADTKTDAKPDAKSNDAAAPTADAPKPAAATESTTPTPAATPAATTTTTPSS